MGMVSCSECTKKSEHSVVPATPGNAVVLSIALEENIGLLGKRIQNFSNLTDSTSLVVSGDCLFVYSPHGSQIRQIGEKGEGPKQYIRVDKVFVSNKYIYVWNSIQKKILVYTYDGDFAADYTLPLQGIADFVVYKDSLLCCLFNGTEGEKSVEIYDLNTMKIKKTFCSKTEEDQLLFLAENAGGLCLSGNKLFWGFPSKLILYALDLEHLDKPIVETAYRDDDFKVESLKMKAYELINANKLKAMEFINSNSRIVQLDADDEFLYVMAETGKITWESDGSFNNEGRKIKLYVIDVNNNIPLFTHVYDIPSYCGLYKMVNGHLYMFRASFSEDDFKVWMDRISVHPMPISR